MDDFTEGLTESRCPSRPFRVERARTGVTSPSGLTAGQRVNGRTRTGYMTGSAEGHVMRRVSHLGLWRLTVLFRESQSDTLLVQLVTGC